MKCPNCDGTTKVIETRHSPEATRRRRVRTECETRLTTAETIVWEDAPDDILVRNISIKKLIDRKPEELANKILKQKLLDWIAQLEA